MLLKAKVILKNNKIFHIINEQVLKISSNENQLVNLIIEDFKSFEKYITTNEEKEIILKMIKNFKLYNQEEETTLYIKNKNNFHQNLRNIINKIALEYIKNKSKYKIKNALLDVGDNFDLSRYEIYIKYEDY